MHKHLLLLLRFITQRLYTFRGGQRIAEAIRTHFSRKPVTVVVPDFDGSLSFACSLNEHMGSQIFWRGYYSRDQLMLLGRLLKPSDVFIDIGAHHGEFTLFCAKRVTAGQVVSVEASSSNFTRLSENIRRNALTNVRPFHCAVGSEPSTASLFTCDRNAADHTSDGGLMTLFRSDERCQYVEKVPVVPLDSLVAENDIPSVSVMKIDVEGSELAVIAGARRTIERFRPVILMEIARETCAGAGYTMETLLDAVRESGYRCEIIGPAGRTAPLEMNSLKAFQNIVCYPDQGK